MTRHRLTPAQADFLARPTVIIAVMAALIASTVFGWTAVTGQELGESDRCQPIVPATAGPPVEYTK